MKSARIATYLKSYVLKVSFREDHISTQVIHSPTGTVALSASSEEKILQATLGSVREAAAASMIGKLLGDRLKLRGIPAVSISMKKDLQCHVKVKAVIEAVRQTGVEVVQMKE